MQLTTTALTGRVLRLRAAVSVIFGLSTDSLYRVQESVTGSPGDYAIIQYRGRCRFALVGPQYFHTATEDILHGDAVIIGIPIPFEAYIVRSVFF